MGGARPVRTAPTVAGAGAGDPSVAEFGQEPLGAGHRSGLVQEPAASSVDEHVVQDPVDLLRVEPVDLDPERGGRLVGVGAHRGSSSGPVRRVCRARTQRRTTCARSPSESANTAMRSTGSPSSSPSLSAGDEGSP